MEARAGQREGSSRLSQAVALCGGFSMRHAGRARSQGSQSPVWGRGRGGTGVKLGAVEPGPMGWGGVRPGGPGVPAVGVEAGRGSGGQL